MRRTLRCLLTAGLLTAGIIAPALPASANSLSGSIQAGSYSYNDGTDQFCARSGGNYKSLDVTLTPSSSSQGPTRTIQVRDGASKCVSLATAYEDTRYSAQILGFDSNGGGCRCGERSGTNFTFYS